MQYQIALASLFKDGPRRPAKEAMTSTTAVSKIRSIFCQQPIPLLACPEKPRKEAGAQEF